MRVDYLIVGSGLTGATIARSLADQGREVLVVDRRFHVGGNVHDHTHPSGIRIHTYGPHYFRTSSGRIWDWVTRFGEFYRYEPALLSDVDGRLEQWPIAGSYIRRLFNQGWTPDFIGQPANFEEAALAIMPRIVYEKFVRDYNLKQWGVPCTSLSATLCGRFDVRHDDEPRLKPNAKHQGLPVDGYAAWTKRILEGIPALLNYDFTQRREDITARRLTVYTGPIDEFFNYDMGRLAYRGQRRHHTYYSDVEYAQPCGQVNNPTLSGGPHIRTLEWKHMMQRDYASRITGTVLTTEIPFSPADSTDYEYPFPDQQNASLYKRYRQRADALPNTLIAGRLGDYRYYDMDQAIGKALSLADEILGRH